MTKVKLCGMRRLEDIAMANECKPDYIGFIFVPDRKRYVSPEQAKLMKEALLPGIEAVGVFVNASLDEITSILDLGVMDVIQLHGTEDNDYICALRELTDKPIWKACSIRSIIDIELAENSSADMVLLDSGAGGSGESFDWSLLQHIKRSYMLAGGLHPGNVREAIERLHPYGVDVSSGTETDGCKDRTKMLTFMSQTK